MTDYILLFSMKIETAVFYIVLRGRVEQYRMTEWINESVVLQMFEPLNISITLFSISMIKLI